MKKSEYFIIIDEISYSIVDLSLPALFSIVFLYHIRLFKQMAN